MDKKKIVLIIPYRGIGDLIFHIPLIKGLYDKYNSKINIITNSVNKAKILLGNEFYINKIYYLSFIRENQIKNSYRFLQKINLLKADLSILTAPSNRLIIPLLFSNSKKKIYFKKDNINDLSKYIFFQSIKQFPNISFKKDYRLVLNNKKIKNQKIFLSIDSHHDQNNWEEYNYINLTKKLLKIKKIKKIFINFSPNKKKQFNIIYKKFLKNKKIFFTYNSKFNDIVNIISGSSTIIGNESGPVCLGASFGKNVFSIYNPIHTPNLSSKIINKKIKYFNSKKLKSENIIRKIIKAIS